jgi:hypothetical protein
MAEHIEQVIGGDHCILQHPAGQNKAEQQQADASEFEERLSNDLGMSVHWRLSGHSRFRITTIRRALACACKVSDGNLSGFLL